MIKIEAAKRLSSSLSKGDLHVLARAVIKALEALSGSNNQEDIENALEYIQEQDDNSFQKAKDIIRRAGYVVPELMRVIA